MEADLKIAVVIPCYRVKEHILGVISGIGPEVSVVYIVDDACPDESGKFVQERSTDKRLKFIFHDQNQGVGGAVISGYEEALRDSVDVVVKMDGDGQMLGADIPTLVLPLILGEADYTKGNRFDSLDIMHNMPKARIAGNAVLSLWSKMSSGYWSVTDPTNGFTAIHKSALAKLALGKVSNRFFFESDMLFRLNLANAVVEDVSLPARYGSEKSNLKIRKVLVEFPLKHIRNQMKRVLYRYYLREWSIASFELPSSLIMLAFGSFFGLITFIQASQAGQSVTAGQVTVAALSIILGFQLFLSFLAYDIQSEPKIPIQRRVIS